jgi:hypothetical protein
MKIYLNLSDEQESVFNFTVYGDKTGNFSQAEATILEGFHYHLLHGLAV